jgi:putative ABC transport system ATP-binding protein
MNQHPGEAVIHAQGLVKVFGTGESTLRALGGVDLDVPAGQFLAIMGPSGSGKSTLLNILGGIETPTEGDIFLDGVNLATQCEHALTLLRRRRIGFIFQSFNLLPIFTAKENVAFPLTLDGLSPSEAQTRALRMLDQLGLGARAQSFPGNLSGGEQQRVAIARALVIDPTLLLADEPTGNLDSATTTDIVALLRRLATEMRKTLIVVTHDPWIAEQADRVVILRDGCIVSDLAPSALKTIDLDALLKGKRA